MADLPILVQIMLLVLAAAALLVSIDAFIMLVKEHSLEKMIEARLKAGRDRRK